MVRSILSVMFLTAMFAFACSDDGSGTSSASIPTFTGATPLADAAYADENLSTRSWQTPEDVPTVRAYFEDQLAESGFRIVETRPIADGVVIVIEDPEDPAEGATIIVRRDGDTTRIVETTNRNRDDDDDDDEDDPAETPSDDVVVGALPPGFPPDIAFPDDAEFVSASAPLVEETQFFLIEFTAPGNPAEVIAFFNEALPAQGWEAGAASDAPSAFVLNFIRGDDRVTVTGGGSGESTNAAMTVVIRE